MLTDETIPGQRDIYDQLREDAQLTHGSLFSGYGGIDLAVEEVFGARTVWVSDVDPGPCKVLAHRFPGVPNLGDITAVDWETVPSVDVLSGGSPCQDVSAAGRRAGMDEGTRSNLWVQMREAIAVLRPLYVIWENVRGAHSARAHSAVESEPGLLGDGTQGGAALRATGRVLGDLAHLGYDAEWTTLPASGVGAPHRRERVFVLAWDATAANPVRGGSGGRALVSFGGETRGADAAADGANHRPDAPGGPAGVALLPTPTVNDMGAAYTPNEWDEWTARMREKHGNGNGHGKSLSIEAQRISLLPTPDAYAGTRSGTQHPAKRRAGGHSVSVADVVEHVSGFGPYADAIARWEAVTGRPAPAPTEPNAQGRPRLSPAFVEWMMGLPAGWVTSPELGLSRVAQLRLLGNGVVPQQAAHALRLLLTRRDEMGLAA